MRKVDEGIELNLGVARDLELMEIDSDTKGRLDAGAFEVGRDAVAGVRRVSFEWIV